MHPLGARPLSRQLGVIALTGLLIDLACKEKREIVTQPSIQALIDSVPEFGGAFMDQARITVYMTDTAGSPKVRRLLRGHEVDIRQGKYTYAQLEAWRVPLTREVLSLSGTVLLDLDETRNRLLIGIERDTLRKVVNGIVAKVGVPSEAVVIEVVEPIRQFSDALGDFSRPVVGGQQISGLSTGFFLAICTLGFNARLSGSSALSFITNSHCTKARSVVDGTVFHQPGLTPTAPFDANLLGTEVSDPGFNTNPFICPSGRKCRFSDAARVRYANAVNGTLGRIARTGGPNNGSLEKVGTFRVIEEGGVLFAGIPVSKVGITTGWTRGKVTNTCVTLNVASPDGAPTDLTLICQVAVSAGSGGGDSGSPVFIDLPQNRAILVGILWGGTSNSYAYSPLKSIEGELGALTTF